MVEIFLKFGVRNTQNKEATKMFFFSKNKIADQTAKGRVARKRRVYCVENILKPHKNVENYYKES